MKLRRTEINEKLKIKEVRFQKHFRGENSGIKIKCRKIGNGVVIEMLLECFRNCRSNVLKISTPIQKEIAFNIDKEISINDPKVSD